MTETIKKDLNGSITILSDALKSDIAYRESWIANIAMSYIDCERWYKERTKKKFLNKSDKHTIANESAKHFLNILCADEYSK